MNRYYSPADHVSEEQLTIVPTPADIQEKARLLSRFCGAQEALHRLFPDKAWEDVCVFHWHTGLFACVFPERQWWRWNDFGDPREWQQPPERRKVHCPAADPHVAD